MYICICTTDVHSLYSVCLHSSLFFFFCTLEETNHRHISLHGVACIFNESLIFVIVFCFFTRLFFRLLSLRRSFSMFASIYVGVYVNVGFFIAIIITKLPSLLYR